MKKLVAVLGSNGQLGKTLEAFEGQNNTYKFYTREDIDITKKTSIEAAFKEYNFEYCINCAAYTNVEGAENDAENAFLVNALGAKNIAEVCKDNGTKLLHISTDYVFDGTKTSPYKTDAKTNPINEYGKSKLKGENFIKEILTDYYIIRTSWLYSVYGKNFMKTIINKIADDNHLKITLQEKGTPTSCIDLARFIVFIVANKGIPYGVYHFSGRGNTTWFGFAKEIAKLFDLEKLGNITSVATYKTIARRPEYSVLDVSKTENVYKPLDKWEDSLSKTFEQYKFNQQ